MKKLGLIIVLLVLAVSASAETAIENAAKEGKLELVRSLIEKGADVNEIDKGSPHEMTPLIAAIYYRHPEIAMLLLEHGANPNLRSGVVGVHPLLLAASEGQLDVVKALVEKGADLEAVSLSDGTNRTPLVWAVLKGHEDMALYLLSKGANPNVVWTHPLDETLRESALATARKKKLSRLVDALIAKGAK